MEKKLRESPPRYMTADFQRPDVDVRLDIVSMPFADNAFKGIICSHVLEHVVDDRSAMRELSRVLDPDGWALVIVPIAARETYEDPAVVEPAARLREFGQEDHVRRYGLDVEQRLERWFWVRRIAEQEAIGRFDPERVGVGSNGFLFLCRKR
jgi:predicted SAM-dependent methyltransferase